MSTVEQQEGLAEAHALYDEYVKPLEADHWGEYAAVTPDGRVFLGEDKREVLDRLVAAVGLGSGSYVFKVGPLVVGRWR